MTDIEAAIVAAFKSTAKRVEWMTLDDFRQIIKDAEIEPVRVGGQVVGAIVILGAEIHACILPEFRGLWMSKRTLSTLLRVVQNHGYAKTTATTDEGRYFVKRLGFIREGDVFVLRGNHGH